MHLLVQMITHNRVAILCIHPFVFFLVGFSIFIKNKTYSRFHITNSLKYLGEFCIVHSISDWGDVFIPLQSGYLSTRALLRLESIQLGINALSFTILLYFGLHLLHLTFNLSKKWLLIPPVLFLLRFVDLFVVSALQAHISLPHALIFANSRLDDYLIILPAAIVSAIAISLQTKQFEQLNMPFMKHSLHWTAIAIVIYTLSDSFLRFYGSVFFIPISNTPVEMFRTVIGIVMGLLILRILSVVDIEYHRDIQEAQRIKVLTSERNRIAKDLHDGMIQSIYAYGLELDTIRVALQTNGPSASETLIADIGKMTERLNGLISEIRGYIADLLEPLGDSPGLQTRVQDLVENLRISTPLEISLDFDPLEFELPLEITLHLYYIIKEALSNIIKHAKATQGQVSVTSDGRDFIARIMDNGIGIDGNEEPSSGGLGLTNMHYRADSIGGTCKIKSNVPSGTVVEVRIGLDRLRVNSSAQR